MKKITKIVLIIVFVLSVFSIGSYASFEKVEVHKSKEFEKWENLSDEERKNSIEPFYTTISTKNAIKRSTYNSLLKNLGASAYGDKYDLRESIEGLKVKNQHQTGSCWAFSYSSMVETTFYNKYKGTYKEFSPMHLDYRAAKMYNRKVGDSGSMLMEMAYSADRYGPVYESELPFESVYSETNNSRANYYLSDINSVSTDQENEVKIEDMTLIAAIEKEYTEAGIKYTSGEEEISKDQVNNIRELIKKQIKEKGAITTQFYSDIGVTASDEYISEGNFYNDQTHAYYCNNSSKSVNHALTIVGWDDDYSVENFNQANKPADKGAYIILNSYGEEFGDSGYFYVSYDDAFIEQIMVGIKSLSLYDDENEKPNYTYQYDELGSNNCITYGTPYLYAANVFEKKSDTIEYIDEIGLSLQNTEGVEIYISKDGNLSNFGNPVASCTGSNALEMGYHIVKLASPVKIENNKFAVIVKYINTESAGIPIECNLKDSNFSFLSTVYDTASSNAGESFISTDGNQWSDMDGLKVGMIATLKNTNACIKAFTTLVGNEIEDPEPNDPEPNDPEPNDPEPNDPEPNDPEPNDPEPNDPEPQTEVSVTGVSLNKRTEKMEIGDKLNLVATIKPTNATNKNVTWKSSNTDVAVISKEGIITAVAQGTATITVTTEDGNYTASCLITVNKKTNIDDDIYKETPEKDDINIKEDNTIANKTVLPLTGTQFGVIVVILITIVGIVFYIKYKRYDDVK